MTGEPRSLKWSKRSEDRPGKNQRMNGRTSYFIGVDTGGTYTEAAGRKAAASAKGAHHHRRSGHRLIGIDEPMALAALDLLSRIVARGAGRRFP